MTARPNRSDVTASRDVLAEDRLSPQLDRDEHGIANGDVDGNRVWLNQQAIELLFGPIR